MANILKQHTPNSNQRKNKQAITYHKNNEHNYIITGIRKQLSIIALNRYSLSSSIDYNEKKPTMYCLKKAHLPDKET